MLNKKRKMMIGAVLVIGILITSIWAWNLWKSEEKEEETRAIRLIPIAMGVDSKDNVHIAFQFGHPIGMKGEYDAYYIKLSESGGTLIRKGLRTHTPSHSAPLPSTSIAVDKTDNIHIIYQYHYFKLDNNGNELLNKTLMDPTWNCTTCISSLAVGMNNYVHIVMKEGKLWSGGKLHYIKLDNSGDILIQKELTTHTEATEANIKIDNEGQIHVFWCNSYSLYEIYHIKLDNSGNIVIPEHRVSFRANFAIDSENNIHLVGGFTNLTYAKLNSNGTSLISEREIGCNGSRPSIAINSEGQLYMVWYEIWFMKLDNNGSILVSPTKISLEGCTFICHLTISMSSNNTVYVAFFGVENRKEGIYFMKLNGEGSVITPKIKIYEYD